MELISWNLNGLDEALSSLRAEAALQDILLGARLDQIAEGRAPRSPPHVVLL